jgi:hypothetical protein
MWLRCWRIDPAQCRWYAASSAAAGSLGLGLMGQRGGVGDAVAEIEQVDLCGRHLSSVSSCLRTTKPRSKQISRTCFEDRL